MLDFSCTAQTARVPAALQESSAQQVAQATLQNEMLAGQTDLGEQSESYSSHSSSSTSGDSVITDGLVCSPFTHEMLSDAAECISALSAQYAINYIGSTTWLLTFKTAIILQLYPHPFKSHKKSGHKFYQLASFQKPSPKSLLN